MSKVFLARVLGGIKWWLRPRLSLQLLNSFMIGYGDKSIQSTKIKILFIKCFPCARHCATNFTWVSSFKPMKWELLLCPFCQWGRRELKHREVKKYMQVTQPRKNQSQNWNPIIQIPDLKNSNILPYRGPNNPLWKLICPVRDIQAQAGWHKKRVQEKLYGEVVAFWQIVMDKEVSRGRKRSKGRVEKKAPQCVWETAHRQSNVAGCGLFV